MTNNAVNDAARGRALELLEREEAERRNDRLRELEQQAMAEQQDSAATEAEKQAEYQRRRAADDRRRRAVQYTEQLEKRFRQLLADYNWYLMPKEPVKERMRVEAKALKDIWLSEGRMQSVYCARLLLHEGGEEHPAYLNLEEE